MFVAGCGHYIYWDCSIPPDFQKWQNLDCRLAGLPDLDQDNPYVLDQLMTWIKWMRGMYGFTAMRVDALANIPPVSVKWLYQLLKTIYSQKDTGFDITFT